MIDFIFQLRLPLLGLLQAALQALCLGGRMSELPAKTECIRVAARALDLLC